MGALARNLESDHRALEVAKTIGHSHRLGDLKANMGASVILLGDYVTARYFTETALEIGDGPATRCRRILPASGRNELATVDARRCWEAMRIDPTLRLPCPINPRLDITEMVGVGHPVGVQALVEGVDLHRETARSIADPALRRTFMEAVPASRTLATLSAG